MWYGSNVRYVINILINDKYISAALTKNRKLAAIAISHTTASEIGDVTRRSAFLTMNIELILK